MHRSSAENLENKESGVALKPEADHTVWRRRLRRLARPAWLGTLRRLTPLSDYWGFDRGAPVDRYYIERFLEQHRLFLRDGRLEPCGAGRTLICTSLLILICIKSF